MGFLSRLFGGNDGPERQPPVARQRRAAQTDDERAVERYRYLLQTAPPETIEQAHAEAFARLTPEQRQMVLQELSQDLPENERAAAARAGDAPNALARMATRAEMRRPGTLQRSFGGMGGGMGGIGMGGLMAGSFLSTIAGVVVGSAIADAFFADAGDDQGSADGQDTGDGGDAGADAGADAGGDFGGDAGGFGDFGGDLGGDFGGGDF